MVHALAAGAELQRCLLRPLGAAGAELGLPWLMLLLLLLLLPWLPPTPMPWVLLATEAAAVCKCRVAKHAV